MNKIETKELELKKKLIALNLAKKTVCITTKPKNPFGYIYVITHISTGQTYTGQKFSTDELDGYCCSSQNIHFWRTLELHPEDFKREVVCWVENKPNAIEILNIAETFFIIVYNSYYGVGGYNLTFGGDSTLGYKYTKEQLLQHRIKHNTPEVIENHKKATAKQLEDPQILINRKEPTKQAMNRSEVKLATSIRKKEEWSDPEYKEKFSESQSKSWKKRRGYEYIKCIEDNLDFKSSQEAAEYYKVSKLIILNSIKTGQDILKLQKTFAAYNGEERVFFPEYNPIHPPRHKKFSDESKRRLSESHKGQKAWNKGKVGVGNLKRVQCIETGIIYDYIKKASEELNINAGHISACCKGKRKTAKKLHFKYL
jgi:hypothetical protein